MERDANGRPLMPIRLGQALVVYVRTSLPASGSQALLRVCASRAVYLYSKAVMPVLRHTQGRTLFASC